MAKVTGRPTVELVITIELTEAEAGALDAIVGYGGKPFLDAFYEKMGRAYLEPYEAGVLSLFDSLRGKLDGQITRAREARNVFNGELFTIRPEEPS